MKDAFFIIIGINIGIPLGWYFYKKFNGNWTDFMNWICK